MIKQDMAEDVRRYDGNLAAAISALAGMVAALDERIYAAIEQHREDAPHIYPDGSTS